MSNSSTRNRRDVDPSAPPLPYPLLMVPVFFSRAGSTLTVTLRNGGTYSGFSASTMVMGTVQPYETNTGKILVSYALIPGDTAKIVFTFNEPLEVNDEFFVPQWSQMIRGINGEWIAPAIVLIPPV